MNSRSFLHGRGAVFVLCSLFVFGRRDICAQEKKEPTIQISLPNYTHPKTVASLRQFDLRNGEAIIFGDNGVPDFRAHLRQGAYEKRDKSGGDSLEFKWTKFIGNDAAEPDYVIAYYVWVTWAGSSSDYGVIHLLHLENGRPKVLQQILFNMRGSEKAGASFNGKSGVLTVRGLNEWDHCCPTGLDVVKFRLKERVLKRVYFGKAALE